MNNHLSISMVTTVLPGLVAIPGGWGLILLRVFNRGDVTCRGPAVAGAPGWTPPCTLMVFRPDLRLADPSDMSKGFTSKPLVDAK